jgi:vacuolar-type H+-ATPase subunit I/STV1
MPHRRVQRERTSTYSIEDIIRDIKALNSSVLLLSQKMNYLVRNEKILGRNFIILNKKLKALEQKKPSFSVSGEASDEIKDLLAELEEKVKHNSFMLNELKSDFSKLGSVYAKAEDLKELKYIVEAINPLEFVTLEQVKDLIAERKSKTVQSKKPKKKK